MRKWIERSARRSLRCLALCAFFAITIVDDVGAAVRVCHALVVSDIHTASNVKTAKRAALADWMARAKLAGLEHPSWRLAYNRRLRCEVVEGHHECVALGQPCTIKQVAPEKRLPLKGPEKRV